MTVSVTHLMPYMWTIIHIYDRVSKHSGVMLAIH
jgi:hypothetical protein